MVLSNHANSLVPKERDKYIAKLDKCNCLCPYTLPDSLWKYGSQLEGIIPPLDRRELIFYLTERHSTESGEKLRCFKNLLDGPQYVNNGWVSNFGGLSLLDGNILIRAKVTHSQSLHTPPLNPWMLISKTGGSVIDAHCDCVAG